jgi:hypothetical protein
MIPGIVGIIEYGDTAACADIISGIQCPAGDSCPVGSNEVIGDPVVLPLRGVFPTLDKRHRHVTASQESDFTPTPVSHYGHYPQREHDHAIQDPVDVKVHPQDRQEMPQNKEERRISRQPNSGSPGKVDTARRRAITLFIYPRQRKSVQDHFGDSEGTGRHNARQEEPPWAIICMHPAERQREANVDNRERYGDYNLHGLDSIRCGWEVVRAKNSSPLRLALSTAGRMSRFFIVSNMALWSQ